MTRVLAISGSLREGSFTTSVLRAAGRHAPDGVAYEVLDPAALKALEPYDQDDDSDSPPVGAAALRQTLRQADVVLIGTPEYNGTMPGQLKHLIDWGSRPRGETAALYAKPIAVISVSPSDYGAQWAGEATRKALGVAGAQVLEEIDLAVGGIMSKLGTDGELIDEELSGRLSELVHLLAAHHKAVAS
jgi:chromate reductase